MGASAQRVAGPEPAEGFREQLANSTDLSEHDQKSDLENERTKAKHPIAQASAQPDHPTIHKRLTGFRTPFYSS